jgi:hypothetical protein
VIKLRIMRWAGNVEERMRGEICAVFRWGNLREKTNGETQV